MSTETYLVLCATGRQGSAVIDALIANNVKSIVGSSRNPASLAAKRGNSIKTIKADMNDTASILEAIDKSNATVVWFTTDWYSIKKPTRAKEAQLGYNVIDAIKKRSDKIKHVVYNSGAYVDNVPLKMQEFWSKADVEKYMEKKLSSVSTTWSVLRPVAFLDNLDDAKNKNALKKGHVKMLTKASCPVKWISTTDIGKGSAALLMNPDRYAGKKLDAATCEYTGDELAQVLSEVSGTKCTYSLSLPRWVVWLFVNNLYQMVRWLESSEGGYKETDIEAFKKVVPDYQDANDWFASKGKWSDGAEFLSARA